MSLDTNLQSAFNAIGLQVKNKVSKSDIGIANGIASLGADGKVPASQLPSFVDDVVEYESLLLFPTIGDSGKIYVAIDTNKTYRWSGTTYVYITSGAVDSVAGKTGVVTLDKGDVGLAKKFKKQVGEENHTFGELCANSDVVIQRSRLPQKFLEDGMINGKLMKLVVNKSIVVNHKNEMFAICGSGRDVTEWYISIEKAIKNLRAEYSCFDKEKVNKILEELNKLKFKEGDHVKQ